MKNDFGNNFITNKEDVIDVPDLPSGADTVADKTRIVLPSWI